MRYHCVPVDLMPGRADRIIAIGGALDGRVPALQDKRKLSARRRSGISLNPMALDHGAAGRDRLLLISRRKIVRSQLTLQIVEDMQRLARRRKDGADLAVMKLAAEQGGRFVALRDRRQVEDGPFIGIFKDEAVRSSMCTRCITMTMAPVCLLSRRDSSVLLYQELTPPRFVSEYASIGFKGSLMMTRSPPRPVRVPPTEVDRRKPRCVSSISPSLSFLPMTVFGKIARYQGAVMIAHFVCHQCQSHISEKNIVEYLF